MSSLRQVYLSALVICAATSHAQWVTEPDVPALPFDGGYAFTVENKIYVGVGDDLFVFDPVAGTWQPRAAFPGEGDDRGWASAFVIDGIAYVGFGITTGNIFRTDLQAYDPATDTWSARASFPGTARGGCASFVVDGKAYICGGTSTGPTFSDVYRYDPVANSWTLVSNLPTGTRGFATGFAIGGYGYVYGGYVGAGNETAELHRYDPASNTWTARASFPGGGRQSAIGLVVGGKALVGLGHAGFFTGYTSCYTYDPVSNAWTADDTFTGGARIAPVAAQANGTVYVGAGYDMTFTASNDWWSNSGLVGIADHARAEGALSIAPSVAMDAVTISLRGSERGMIRIYDAAGALALSKPIAGGTERIDLGPFHAGPYAVHFISAGGGVSTGRFIKQ